MVKKICSRSSINVDVVKYDGNIAQEFQANKYDYYIYTQIMKQSMDSRLIN